MKYDFQVFQDVPPVLILFWSMLMFQQHPTVLYKLHWVLFFQGYGFPSTIYKLEAKGSDSIG